MMFKVLLFLIDDESIAKPPDKLDPKNGQFIEPITELSSIFIFYIRKSW